MYKHLTQEERYYIWQRIANLDSMSKIAKDLKVPKSTVSRELKRNAKADGSYNPGYASKAAFTRKSNASSKQSLLNKKPKLFKLVTSLLYDGWSPEQISGRLRKIKRSNISHQTIYNYINQDKLAEGSLYTRLRHKGKKYNYKSSTKSLIPNRVDISFRPKIVELKKRVGDFEADTIIGTKYGSSQCLLTLVDRKTKYCFIRKSASKSAFDIQQAFEDIYANSVIPFKTITSDNGSEFTNHLKIKENLDCEFYFARPYCSCDRGLNEHTNGLIRYILPKKTDFANVSHDTIQFIQNKLNNRPRKSLGFLTPAEVILKHLKRLYPKNHSLHLII